MGAEALSKEVTMDDGYIMTSCWGVSVNDDESYTAILGEGINNRPTERWIHT